MMVLRAFIPAVAPRSRFKFDDVETQKTTNIFQRWREIIGRDTSISFKYRVRLPEEKLRVGLPQKQMNERGSNEGEPIMVHLSYIYGTLPYSMTTNAGTCTACTF